MTTNKLDVSVLDLAMVAAVTLCVAAGQAQQLPARQQPPTAGVPRLLQISGMLKDVAGRPVVGVTFALYKDQEGGSPIWLETQNVAPDENGRYTVLLGATRNEGLPSELFTFGEARWLGMQPEGQTEQARVALLSVPYALKATDADTLGGHPASAFVLAESLIASGDDTRRSGVEASSDRRVQESAATAVPAISGTGTTNFIPIWSNSTTLGNSAIFQSGALIGVGTQSPAGTLDVRGGAVIAIRGESRAATGKTRGVFGQTDSTTTGATGVYGNAVATTGAGHMIGPPFDKGRLKRRPRFTLRTRRSCGRSGTSRGSR